jgi:DNA-binding NtrC family response regulator
VQAALASHKLREDLYYRLNAFTLHVPPLRERKEEVPLLLKHFMTRVAERYGRPPLPFSPGLLDSCLKYNWPGNVRELENFVKRYLILGEEAQVIRELDPKDSAGPESAPKPPDASNGGLKSLVRSLKDEAEAEAIARTLEQTNWNRKEAARILNISYKALLYKTRQYGIEGPGRQSSRFRDASA